MDRAICAESSTSNQPVLSRRRDPDDRRVAAVVFSGGLHPGMVARASSDVRGWMDLAVHRPLVRRKAAGVFQGLAVSLRRASLVDGQDAGARVAPTVPRA